MRTQNQAKWITFNISRTSGNCEPGTQEFSLAIYKLLERDGIAGFRGFASRAEAYYHQTGQDNVAISIDVVQDYMARADGHDVTPECMHNCADDCYTCESEDHHHDCEKFVERVRSLIGETRSYWICEHVDSCNCCECETDEEREDCTCCEHSCADDCNTCEEHARGRHDCHDGGRYCNHDCTEADCSDGYGSDHDLSILAKYEHEWSHALKYANQMATLHRANLSEDNAMFMQENFTIVDTWTDPTSRVRGILQSDGHALPSLPRSNMPRLIGRSGEYIHATSISSLHHGFAGAESRERIDAIAFLLSGQLFGVLNQGAPGITYGMRGILRNMAQFRDARASWIAERIASNQYAQDMTQVIHDVAHYHTRTIGEYLTDFVYDMNNAHALAKVTDSQPIVNVFRYHSDSTSQHAMRAHRIYNGLRNIATERNVTHYPFAFIVLELTKHVQDGVIDIVQALNSDEFKLAFDAFNGIVQPTIVSRDLLARSVIA